MIFKLQSKSKLIGSISVTITVAVTVFQLLELIADLAFTTA